MHSLTYLQDEAGKNALTDFAESLMSDKSTRAFLKSLSFMTESQKQHRSRWKLSGGTTEGPASAPPDSDGSPAAPASDANHRLGDESTEEDEKRAAYTKAYVEMFANLGIEASDIYSASNNPWLDKRARMVRILNQGPSFYKDEEEDYMKERFERYNKILIQSYNG